MRWTFAIVAAVTLAACAEAPVAAVVPSPVAGLVHPEVARVGQTVLLDAGTSAVAKAQAGAAGGHLVRFRFVFADGTVPVEQAGPQLAHAFALAGAQAVEVTVFDDRGLSGRVVSTLHVVDDYTATCQPGATIGCATGLCAGDTCAVLACGGQAACDSGLGGKAFTCDRGTCTTTPGPKPAADAYAGQDTGTVALHDAGR